MSSAGFMPGEWNQGQLGNINPDDTRQQMARFLMGQMQPQGQNGGMANGLGMLGSALAMKALQQRHDQIGYDKTPPITAAIPFQGINGQMQNTTLSQKLPYMGPTGLSGLFSFGGGN